MPQPLGGDLDALRSRQRFAWWNDTGENTRLQVGWRNRPAGANAVFTTQQGRAPLVEVVLTAVVNAAVVLLIRVGRNVRRNHPHVERQTVVIRRVRTGPVNTALGEDNELAGRNRQLDAIFHLLIKVERVGSLVEAFFTAEADFANTIVRAAGKPQAAPLRRGVVDRDPHGQLKNFAAIGRENARVLVIFDHERARLVPLNGGRLRAFIKILRTPNQQIGAQQL